MLSSLKKFIKIKIYRRETLRLQVSDELGYNREITNEDISIILCSK
ncbi:MAG: hypothetical protein ACK4NF_06025 [Planctomycetota bacterium]